MDVILTLLDATEINISQNICRSKRFMKVFIYIRIEHITRHGKDSIRNQTTTNTSIHY